jgi:hypothetical protein
MGVMHKLDRECLAVRAASDFAPSFATFRVNPGYSVDDQKSANVVSHCAAALDYSTLVARSSFLTAPRHIQSGVCERGNSSKAL